MSDAAEYLRSLTSHPDRHVGSEGNRAATALFAEEVARHGFSVSRTPFDCIEWEYGDAVLEAGGDAFEVLMGPYSLGVDVSAELVAAGAIEELESEAVRGRIVLLHGELARHQVMPRNFTFYNPEEHRRIVRALDEYAPAAVVAATGRDAEMVGSQYPFPLFEDGDLDVPNAYMTDAEGERLLAHVGGEVRLALDSRRVPATAEHVVATRAGDRSGRIVISAHIDSRKGSPGALDNASGVATVLLAAEMLEGYDTGPTIELVPFNGEDNYANPGELMWMAENDGRLGDIVLGINIDDLGMRGTMNHVSFYNCGPGVERAVREAMALHPSCAEGPQWYQGDHAMLAMNDVPAIALSSSGMMEFMAKYAHTERDAIGLADPSLIADAAALVRDIVERVAALDA